MARDRHLLCQLYGAGIANSGGRFAISSECPLYPQKRTLNDTSSMSAFDPKRTLQPNLKERQWLEWNTVLIASDEVVIMGSSGEYKLIHSPTTISEFIDEKFAEATIQGGNIDDA